MKSELLSVASLLLIVGTLSPMRSVGASHVAPLDPPGGRIDMILDSDMYNEVDDQFALAFAVRSPERITLKAVCAAPFRNQRSRSAGEGMEKSYEETLRVLKLLKVPTDGLVFRGSANFLPDRKTPVDSPAARRIIALAHEPREKPLYVVGLGAASNLASALLLDPTITNHVVFVWIGGQPHVWKSALDFNLQQDVAAAQLLFDIGVPLVHVPAGVAAGLTITLPELEAGLNDRSPIADMLYQNVEDYYLEVDPEKKAPRSGPGAWQKVIWDIATIAWLLEPEIMVKSAIVPSPVLKDDGDWGAGKNRHQVRVATGLNRARIYEVLFEKLTN